MKKTRSIVLVAILVLLVTTSCNQDKLNTEIVVETEVPETITTQAANVESEQSITTIDNSVSNSTVPVFLLLTNEIVDELTDISKVITGREDIDRFHKVTRGLQEWEIERHDGKKVTIEVVEKTSISTTTVINTSDLSGSDSKFTIISSEGTVFMIDIVAYTDITKFLFFAPSINEFVVCPYYSVQDWYCNDSIFAPDGSVYVNILISTTGIVVVNPTYMQIENVKHKYDLEYGSDNPSLNPNFQDYLWENKGTWCGKEGDGEISYMLPTLNNTYILGYNNCPEWSIEPFMKLTEDNIDDFGFSIR